MKKKKTIITFMSIFIVLVCTCTFVVHGNKKETGEKIVTFAKSQIDIPYLFGGISTNGFDCSGFVQYVYANFNIDIPRLAVEQSEIGTIISDVSNAKQGDLLFFSNDNTIKGIYHVAIYEGNNKMISALSSSNKVQETEILDNLYLIKRVID